MSCSQKLRGELVVYIGSVTVVIKGDTRSLDSGSHLS